MVDVSIVVAVIGVEAAKLYRNVVHVFMDVDSAGQFMSGRKPGLQARVILADITMTDQAQTGPRSRRACKPIPEAITIVATVA